MRGRAPENFREMIKIHQAAMPVLDGFTRWEGSAITCDGDLWMISIYPSSDAGHYWVQTIRPHSDQWMAVNRPIRDGWVAVTLAGDEFPSPVRWESFPAEPLEVNPYSEEGHRLLSKSKRHGQVYFVQGVDGGPIKIGFSADAHSRLTYLQAYSPVVLSVVATIPGSAADERQLHQRFSHARLHGEWFQPTNDLLAFIESLAKPERPLRV